MSVWVKTAVRLLVPDGSVVVVEAAPLLVATDAPICVPLLKKAMEPAALMGVVAEVSVSVVPDAAGLAGETVRVVVVFWMTL